MTGAPLELEIFVAVRQQAGHGGRLEIREALTLQPASFMELCRILGQFADLAEKIKQEQRR